MVDVILVFMPYGAVDRPAIGLGYLASALELVGISTKIIHANILFAEKIGLSMFNRLSGSSNVLDLLGDWTFSGAAFPEFERDSNAYFESLHYRSSQADALEIRKVRELASPFINELAH